MRERDFRSYTLTIAKAGMPFEAFVMEFSLNKEIGAKSSK